MIKHVVMDMDGVLFRGDTPLPEAVEALHILQSLGVKVAYLTNNSSHHRDELMAKMIRLGMPCTLEQMWGSAYATACYLRTEAPDARVFVVGAAGLRRELQEAGLTVLPTPEGVTHVVVGLDRGLSYDKLRDAHQAICQGATFIATNLDAALPDSLTTTAPGGGAVVAALRTSTGIEPILMGKPQTMGIGQIAAAWGVEAGDMAAVGDRLDTDIAAARRFGCLAILVLTGMATREQAQQAAHACKPDVIINNLTELLPILQQPATSRQC